MLAKMRWKLLPYYHRATLIFATLISFVQILSEVGQYFALRVIIDTMVLGASSRQLLFAAGAWGVCLSLQRLLSLFATWSFAQAGNQAVENVRGSMLGNLL
ncbi:MAG: ABC transporter ATP-binding protein [Firmicutes bacterium]|nr:ABC transporter ATP-binding protein [Bacillota bacterium]